MIIAFTQKIADGPLKGWVTDFKAKILDGRKIHTIRSVKKRTYKEGTLLHLAHGVRTKHYDCFSKATCSKVERITIASWNAYHPEIMKGDRCYVHNSIRYTICIYRDSKEQYLTSSEMELLALNDGFDNLDQFFSFFDVKKGHHFTGSLIYWDLIS